MEEDDKSLNSNSNNQTGQTPADLLDIPTVRTYKADVDQTVKGDKINVAKVLIAEQKKKEKKELRFDKNSIENPSNKVKLSFSIFFVALAIVAVIFTVFTFLLPKINNNQNIIIQDPGESFVTDKKQRTDVEGKTEEELQQVVKDFFVISVNADSVNELIFYKNTKEGEDIISEKISPQSFLRILDIELPDILLRTFSNNYILGFVTKNSTNHPFIVFKLADFENAYGNIFDFEPNMIFQMRKLFGGFEEFDTLSALRKERIELLPENSIMISSSTATSTLSIPKSVSTTTSSSTEQLKNMETEISELEKIVESYKFFKDVVLQNTDARVVFGENSKVLFYYAFLDREWIIFADNIEALKEVKRRIREKKLVR